MVTPHRDPGSEPSLCFKRFVFTYATCRAQKRNESVLAIDGKSERISRNEREGGAPKFKQLRCGLNVTLLTTSLQDYARI
jgi:hypothetical protein